MPTHSLRAVHLDVELPPEIAAKVEAVQREDPQMIGRMLRYCVLRKTIFDALIDGANARPTPYLT